MLPVSVSICMAAVKDLARTWCMTEWRSPCSLVVSRADFYAGVHHGVVRGGTCAASGGGASAVT